MVQLGRELASSHRLSIQTTLASGTVWPQFAMKVLTGGCQPRLEIANPQFGGMRGRMGSDMCSLSSPGTTSIGSL